uniref:Uncharacterized protein n=1 Tax=Rhizophora mucronata TaxID=61149 RepID=A0A2P2QPK2_RHIMU
MPPIFHWIASFIKIFFFPKISSPFPCNIFEL